jgi:hypothetical protein
MSQPLSALFGQLPALGRGEAKGVKAHSTVQSQYLAKPFGLRGGYAFEPIQA